MVYGERHHGLEKEGWDTPSVMYMVAEWKKRRRDGLWREASCPREGGQGHSKCHVNAAETQRTKRWSGARGIMS